jgi:hypothetical protein
MPSPAKHSVWPQRVLAVVATLAVVQAIGIAAWFWPGSMPRTDTCGVWITLADDAAHGDLYRPLQSALGTGGTRYMPLFFSLHAAAIKLGFPLVGSGVALNLISALLFMGALGFLLRQLDVAPAIAWPTTLLMTGTITFGMLSLTVRGDFLAAAFNLAGVAMAVSAQPSDRSSRWVWAGIFFAAAFLTKITTVFGLVAVVGWLFFKGKPRCIGRLLTGFGLTAGLGVSVAYFLSDGRIWESFRAVASGGTDSSSWWIGPIRFFATIGYDPLLLLLAIPATVLSWVAVRTGHRLVAWLLASTCAVTLVIFTSPGTGENHLLDGIALAMMVLALASKSGGQPARWAGVTAGILGIGIVVTWFPGVPSIPKFFQKHGRPAMAAPVEFLQLAGPAAHPLLSENPLIPLLVGERPFVADAFNLDLMSRSNDDFRNTFEKRLQTGYFGSVVLKTIRGKFARDVTDPMDPLLTEPLLDHVAHGHLIARFSSQIQSQYRVVYVRRPYVFLLRNDLPFASMRP